MARHCMDGLRAGGQVEPAFIDEIFREAEKELEERLNGDMMICKAFMGL